MEMLFASLSILCLIIYLLLDGEDAKGLFLAKKNPLDRWKFLQHLHITFVYNFHINEAKECNIGKGNTLNKINHENPDPEVAEILNRYLDKGV
jgi:hypothetical protein